VMRRIMTSRAYALPSVASDPEQKPYVFRGPEVRRLSAEQYLDALAGLTGAWPTEAQFALPHPEANAPGKPVRAWRLNSDPPTRALGRPNREQVTTRRDEQATTLQALELSNGATFAAMLSRASEIQVPQGPEARELATRLYRH